MKERYNEASAMTHRFEQGSRRSLNGKPIVIDAVRHIKKSSESTVYVLGYLGPLLKSLEGIGITDPSQIGIHENFEHVLIQDPKLEGASGIEGLSDGTRVIEPRIIEFSQLNKSSLNHYKDGYKIGFAFTRSKLRNGNFEGLASEDKIAKDKLDEVKFEIKNWFDNKNTKVEPDLILHLSYYSRLAFAYFINQGEEGFEKYREKLCDRVLKTNDSKDKKAEIIAGIDKSFNFAKKLKRTKLDQE